MITNIMSEIPVYPENIYRHVLPDNAFINGIFGAMASSPMPYPEDCNTAICGLSRTTGGIKNLPDNGFPWGILYTISTAGCGDDGMRAVTFPLPEGEVVYQLFFNTKSVLYTRAGNWLTGWTAWEKRWG
ncbi:hypothetical protein DU083_22230 [Salmonella enterica subsp. enterica serovar Javiana]|nr:hypothetical protein [Salmonella enterica subsp. enterica serovar Javiana]